MPKKVYQVDTNDCFSACVASILEVPIEEVPNPNDNELGDIMLHHYINSKGYALLSFHIESNDIAEILRPIKQGYYIMSINQADGRYHAVVGHDGKIWHDPDRFSAKEYDYELDCISVFVKLFNEYKDDEKQVLKSLKTCVNKVRNEGVY